MNMFNSDITLYNHYRQGGIDKWKRTVITNVFWKEVKGASSRKIGKQSDDNIVIIIPRTNAIESKYVKPNAFNNLLDKTNAFTFADGDYVLLGDINYDIVNSAKELYANDDVGRITSVNTLFFGTSLDNWEVVAK